MCDERIVGKGGPLKTMRRARILLRSGRITYYEICSSPDCDATPENIVAIYQRHIRTARTIIDQKDDDAAVFTAFRDYASDPPVGLLCVLGPPEDALGFQNG